MHVITEPLPKRIPGAALDQALRAAEPAGTIDLSIDCQCARTANQPVIMSVYQGRITDVWCAVCNRPILDDSQIKVLHTFGAPIRASVTLMMDLPGGEVAVNPASTAGAAAFDLWYSLTSDGGAP